ncbi:hypothetical protein V499_00484 [Pseudogymnoascus sp. VKM F-103]|uniref:NmrA-like domain-containing protein n=1 Tax=Pseudogymnoascus verrucosus TaxID=342668 RepID=A0A1B8GB03_9PEZI|nr:uncharacterized protein VE01_08619 [Pseudogymnoascus verrucosus]KFY80656.1 hypothetical protein V499_00484 [Pseudogymnoascus sp. VKM F-103]OBT93016.1 hypothetical protein VE01_08619 [Pseudogymnoascus verrucosus]
MASDGKKIIVVFGATGVQGGSVIKSILGDSKAAAQFKIRAVTRDPSKPSAKALADQGCELVSADLNSEKDVARVLEGAYGAFAVTNFWETGDPDVELKQGKNVADAAKETGLQHLVWSSLIDVTKLSKGVLTKVSHFDSKAAVEDYIRSIGINASFFRPGYYMSNLQKGGIVPNGDGTYSVPLPIPTSAPIPLFDTAADTGKFAKAILLAGDKAFGKTYDAAVAYVTTAEIAAEWSAVTGKEAKAVVADPEAWKAQLRGFGLSEHAAEELYQNMRLMDEFGYYGGASLEESQKILDEKLTTLKEFIGKQDQWKNL